MFSYGYYFENDKFALEAIMTPIPFELRSMLFQGFILFATGASIIMCLTVTMRSIRRKNKSSIITSQLFLLAILSSIGAMLLYFSSSFAMIVNVIGYICFFYDDFFRHFNILR